MSLNDRLENTSTTMMMIVRHVLGLLLTSSSFFENQNIGEMYWLWATYREVLVRSRLNGRQSGQPYNDIVPWELPGLISRFFLYVYHYKAGRCMLLFTLQFHVVRGYRATRKHPLNMSMPASPECSKSPRVSKDVRNQVSTV